MLKAAQSSKPSRLGSRTFPTVRVSPLQSTWWPYAPAPTIQATSLISMPILLYLCESQSSFPYLHQLIMSQWFFPCSPRHWRLSSMHCLLSGLRLWTVSGLWICILDLDIVCLHSCLDFGCGILIGWLVILMLDFIGNLVGDCFQACLVQRTQRSEFRGWWCLNKALKLLVNVHVVLNRRVCFQSLHSPQETVPHSRCRRAAPCQQCIAHSTSGSHFQEDGQLHYTPGERSLKDFSLGCSISAFKMKGLASHQLL